jgi:hypothetical protein
MLRDVAMGYNFMAGFAASDEKCVYEYATERFCYKWAGSSVGIATAYGLDGPGIESRWGGIFSAPIQTGTGLHPASYSTGTGSFPGVRWPGRGVNHPPHLVPRSKIE